ncbi:MAG: hypothetical protein QOF79_1986 [Actinomycetota bacterium]|jgi:uncharacterized membrane protein HdeD (DUF308 family)|nr:hypothetical protein [Actinomycetota bacterium]
MTVATAPLAPGRTALSLRTLYFVRAAFSVIWVTFVFVLASTLTTETKPSVAAIVLLTIYPLWDVAATVFDIRATPAASTHIPQYLNIAFGAIAAVGILISTLTSLTPALIVFGAWAFASGAIQLVLGLRRRKPVGGQWPMIISGGLSVLAGISFAATASAPKTGLTTLAGYSAFGAFWYLVGALLLIRAARRRA